MTAEQASLIRKADDSLRAAKLLASQGHYEISVSRSYYVMFYVAQGHFYSLMACLSQSTLPSSLPSDSISRELAASRLNSIVS